MSNFIIENEIKRRYDFRDILTFTIDPESAKDYDDALSFQILTNNLYQVGVHIADVSFYVKENSDIDQNAYQMGTSTYLVNKVIPMLPSYLSDDICSLRENENRLCMSVIFKIDNNANVIKYKICRTVINSNARLTYTQAQQMIETPQENNNELQKAMKFLWHAASIFRNERIKKGALTFSQDELHFILNEQQQPVDIYIDKPTESHFLIEEWMLLANKTIATHIKNRPFIYRVHDKPKKDKIRELKHFNRIFNSYNDTFKNKLIEMMTIRSMEKAIYSVHNIGHYGLAFPCYTHFTSPIRRYPDLIVHRLVDNYLLSNNSNTYSRNRLKKICDHCSSCETNAQIAERDSIKEMQIKWLQQAGNQIFDAHIVSIVEFGFFVQLVNSLCEGLVRIKQLYNIDHFKYFPKLYMWRSDNGKYSFRLGDKVKVKLEKLNLEKKQIDFEIVM